MLGDQPPWITLAFGGGSAANQNSITGAIANTLPAIYPAGDGALGGPDAGIS